MDRQFYLNLAAQGIRMPIGADLLLHEESDPDEIRMDPERLGRVVEKAALRYHTPLAFPLMDLRLEKADLLAFAGIPESEVDQFHFQDPPWEEFVAGASRATSRPFSQRIQANQGALAYIARRTSLLPVGMLIGPFSLMTKLVADPITAVALAGRGVSADEDDSVRLAERCLQLALTTILRSAQAQIQAGAKAIIVCEPAANAVYLSPRQMHGGSNIFQRFVLEPNRQLRALLDRCGVDLIFHDCGELLTEMVQHFANDLRPVILSLGGSRKLWQDSAVVPKDTVLFGNLPTKTFYSDEAMPDDKVESLTRELIQRMAEVGHPHILGSECDVLHVPEAADAIRRKVDIMLSCGVPQASLS